MTTSRRTAALTTALLLACVGCGTESGSDPGTEPDSSTRTTLGPPTSDPSVVTGAPRLTPLGEYRDWSDALRIRVSSEGVDRDERGAWLAVSVRVENADARAQAVPEIELSCDARDAGAPIDPGQPVPTSVGAHAAVEFGLRLPLSGDKRSGAPVPECVGSASIDLWALDAEGGGGTFGRGWAVPADVVDALNAARANAGPPPAGPATDPDRPYAWVDQDQYSSGYQVVVVPGVTADQAIRVLKPLRGAPDPDDYERVVVAEREDGVVLFTWGGLVLDEQVTALSRVRGFAATYGNTVEGGDRILVVRKGKVVRDFDPFLGDDDVDTPPLPQEKGLDFENDTGPASWTLLERLTGIAITEDWLLDDRHPGFVLAAE